MFSTAFFSVTMAVLAGVIIKLLLDANRGQKNITWKELAIGVVVIAILVVPVTAKIGWEIARRSNVTFNEYWNGWEKEAEWTKITCTRDGACVNEYDCDPYTIMVPYEVCDGEGKNCSTHYRPETRYHSCPYCDEEWTFRIHTTLGDSYTVASNVLPDNPQANRYRIGKYVPDWLISRAGVGVPDFWQEAKERIDSGNPGPVTARKNYENYILASDTTILKQHSASVEDYLGKNLLPSVRGDIHSFYYANKVHFVGYIPADEGEWQERLMYLNAALGTELQGDLHLVVVQNAEISANPDRYFLALKAYWQNSKVFGKDAVSKNTVIVAIGTSDGERVEWARATTGMPLGNEFMIVALKEKLKNAEFSPQVIIGAIKGEFYEEERGDGTKRLKVRSHSHSGVIPRILWGLDDPSTKFARVSMTANDIDDVGGGFLYLESEIQPTTNQKIGIVVAAFFLSLMVWVAFSAIGERSRKHHSK